MNRISRQRHTFILMVLLCGLMLTSGCKGTPHVGLKPVYPPVKIGFFDLYSQYVEVGSLRPSFQWEPFPPPAERFGRPAAPDGSFEDVTYELRIWKASPAETMRLVYQRTGLKKAFHLIESPLAPATHYLWSVRAHFTIGGNRRTIEWALAGYALRDETVPNLSCLRFKTPALASP